ncbi:MAG: bifunctional diaminohydroxyphosphoribosylaminopyrimidine deaminase/5-amino-6-(5-phosphoribosylamino)uracil reductase RibD [Paracoccus sp. (in: a-proteobacteria)]|uniref:bifunctional diaminohydroxyphosphoribosylaminopyrimidine deaminase/5-amino-6-(5-phosphoribosylamino)uracil reductase RibD n=1 Tax=Paracoccus sp. TaxID=267 RepID=UPI0026DF9DA9|nr:bifunctional diaminohydroxyphosphoribosylaminopyrimidine deaminase/5-amino-6-(5-phosphoribosylamino)uracil reductase RibD [Paracoccus sp. (in: a-proteobacteria)]MDO5622077.1 bifunctional diaminohydroxyphosphoribosylaminopyrimidine deaminase/5-amino-6-(5-phosphoribosylamino)uracil reductase RibD [Paracoccus sp. (in: a-proteobacteria)]
MNGADSRHMAHALRLAARGLGNTWPNPAVGCVIVTQGRVVGRGWTQPGGRPHAEVVALAQAGAAARGATAYVTLEPCAHHGKTPPCAEALIAAGVLRVVVALTDPDQRVSGRGLAMLRAAGVEVVEGVLTDAARVMQRGFLNRVTLGRPMLTLKLATSFDGRIATGGGDSQWITGPEARRHVHLLRSQHDAVMVGGGTARADLPGLNVRDLGVTHQPLRVVVAREAVPDLPEGPGYGPLWRVTGQGGGGQGRVIRVAEDARGLDPLAIMQALAAEGLTRVFCEGGGQLAAALLRSGQVDELVGYSAGVVIGGDGRASVGAMSLNRLTDAPRFDLIEVQRIGPDLFHRWRLRRDG